MVVNQPFLNFICKDIGELLDARRLNGDINTFQRRRFASWGFSNNSYDSDPAYSTHYTGNR